MRNVFQKAVCIAVAATAALAGCAAPQKLEATPVSPTQYADLDCEQLGAEAQRVLARYAELGGKIEEDVKQDQALQVLYAPTIVLWPLIVFWLPFVPALKERKEEAEQRKGEFKHLMGERDAILQVAGEKGCLGAAQQPKTSGDSKTSPNGAK